MIILFHMSFSMISKILRIIFEKRNRYVKCYGFPLLPEKTTGCFKSSPRMRLEAPFHLFLSQLRSWSKGFVESHSVAVASWTLPPIIMYKVGVSPIWSFLFIFGVILHEKPMIMRDFGYVFMGFMDLGSQTMLTESIMSYCDEDLTIIA